MAQICKLLDVSEYKSHEELSQMCDNNVEENNISLNLSLSTHTVFSLFTNSVLY